MSIFSILNKGDISRSVLSELPPQYQRVAGALGQFEAVRNLTGFSPQVPKNVQKQFNIDNFRGELSKLGIAHNNRFSVEINPPAALEKDEFDISALRLRCYAANLPGRTLMLKDDIRRYGFGAIDKVPHATFFDPVTLSFIVDSRGILPAFFNRWLSYIHSADIDAEKGTFDETGETVTTDYLVNYKQNYASPLKIRQLTTLYDRGYGVALREAFPINIGEQQYSWDNNNSISILPVTFAYTDYKLA